MVGFAGHTRTRVDMVDDPVGYEVECSCGWSVWQADEDGALHLFNGHLVRAAVREQAA